MKIIEARDGFIKVEAEKKPEISSFLKVNGDDKSYIAQVIQVKNSGKNFVVYAKLLFVYDMDFSVYDKTLPNNTAEVAEFPFEKLSTVFNHKTSVIVGMTKDDYNVTVDRSNLDKLLVSVDSKDINGTLTNNIVKQLCVCAKVFVIDLSGSLDGDKKIAGVDFKLPINKDSLKFIFEDCLNDATSDSKALISDIFKDLAEYSQSVPFVPFSALKTIVDDMVDNSHIFKLLVLKNKLAKFDKLGYFASSVQEAKNFDEILNNNSVVIDLSKLDGLFQNRYLNILLSKMNNIEGEKQIIIHAHNTLDKINLRNIVTNTELPSVLIVNSNFRYLNDIKPLYKNFVIENTFRNKEIFRLYTPFLNAMLNDNYLVVGEGTNYIPLISKTEEIITPQELIFTENVSDNHEELVSNEEYVSAQEHDVSIDAIDKKSDELIDKSATEISESGEISDINIFDNSEEDVQTALSDDEYVDYNDDQEIVVEPEYEDESDELEETEDLEEIDSTDEESQLTEDIHLSDDIIDENDSVDVDDEPVLENENDINEPITLSVQDKFEEYHTEVDSTTVVDMPEIISEPELIEDDTQPSNNSEFDNEAEESLETPDEIVEETSVDEVPADYNSDDTVSSGEMLITENSDLTEDNPSEELFEEIVELDEDNLDADTIVVEMDDDAELQEISSLHEENDAEREIIQDVDKVYTTIKDDTISDSDLDFIDELNDIDPENMEIEETQLEDEFSDNEELEVLNDLPQDDSDDTFLEPIEELSVKEEADSNEILETRNTTTTTVPVYDAEIPQEDKVISDPIAQGDTVVHAKYGTGVVEKMIKYGTKELFSINFDNVGRRLLDPTLTEIKKA